MRKGIGEGEMKAKEYAQRIIDNEKASQSEFDKILYSVAMDLFAELVALVKSRHCACDSAYIAVFDEIDNKWITIARITNEYFKEIIIKPTGFRELAFSIADKAGMWQMRMVWKPKRINE
jgi:hypothetical protein